MSDLTCREIDQLATYNAECSRGIVHTVEWRNHMTDLQRRYNAAMHRDHPDFDPAWETT